MLARNRKLCSNFLDMQKEDSNRLVDFLKCGECHELANEAVNTLCCRAIFCSGCLKGKPCRCKKYPDICRGIPNHLARRMIDSLPWTCPSCHKETTMSEQTAHNLLCPGRERQCPAEGCAFRGVADIFLTHLVDAHKEKICRNRVDLFAKPKIPQKQPKLHPLQLLPLPDLPDMPQHIQSLLRPRLRPLPRERDDEFDDVGNNEREPDELLQEHIALVRNQPPLNTRCQSKIRTVLTGKNYCGRKLNGPKCKCCRRGKCGPDNGCNCVGCMSRDLVTFGVNSPGALVNREGVIARISSQTGLFYCGRPVMNYDTESDGYCGPNSGHNCHACGTLDEQLYLRYRAIVSTWEA